MNQTIHWTGNVPALATELAGILTAVQYAELMLLAGRALVNLDEPVTEAQRAALAAVPEDPIERLRLAARDDSEIGAKRFDKILQETTARELLDAAAVRDMHDLRAHESAEPPIEAVRTTFDRVCQLIEEAERRVRERRLSRFAADHWAMGEIRQLHRDPATLAERRQQLQLFLQALVVGRHWNDQDGVSAVEIDKLAECVRIFDANRRL